MLIHRFDDKVTDTPEHVEDKMKQPSTGVVTLDFGVHAWSRPIKDGGSGYFLNVGHDRKSTHVQGFDGDGVFAKEYRSVNGDWQIRPFMAKNDADLVTKEYLMDVINDLKNEIDGLKEKINGL